MCPTSCARSSAPCAPQPPSRPYTEVWLWDKSGKFQLDTLTEGQRDK
jgi:periplasmic protein TonB